MTGEESFGPVCDRDHCITCGDVAVEVRVMRLLPDGLADVDTGEGTMTGSVFYVVEIFDAPSGRLLSAYVSKQYPSPYDIKASVGALAAAQAGIDKGADALVAQLR